MALDTRQLAVSMMRNQPQMQTGNVSMIQPRQQAFNPDRFAQFSHLAASGLGGRNDNWGDVIGNIARALSGSYGMRQERARERAGLERQAERQRVSDDQLLQQMASYLGTDPRTAGMLRQNPELLKAHLKKPEAPADPRMKAWTGGAIFGPDGAERLPTSTGEAWDLVNEGGFTTTRPEAPPERDRIQQGGRWYYADTGEPVLDPSTPVRQPSDGGDGPGAPELGDVRGLQKDWRQVAGPYMEMRRQQGLMHAGVEEAARGNMAAGSQAVLVTFQKILDPTSVVRESEYARSQDGQNLIGRIEGAYEKLREGGAGLTVEQLQDYVNLANQFVEGMHSDLQPRMDLFGRTADQYGIDRDLLFSGSLAPHQQAAPAERPPALAGDVDTVRGAIGGAGDAVSAAVENLTPEAVDALTPEQAQELYRRLGWTR